MSKRRPHLDKLERAIPPTKCGATAKQTGNQCRRWAIAGGKVCPIHGGKAPAVQIAATKRLALAAALASEPPRHPWEVLEEALHAIDYLMRQALIKLDQPNTMTASDYTELVAAVQRAHGMAKVNLDAGIDQRRQHLAEAQAAQMHQVFTRVIKALNLTPEQQTLIPSLLRREIEHVTRPAITATATTGKATP
jgi:DNA-binding phage protein